MGVVVALVRPVFFVCFMFLPVLQMGLEALGQRFSTFVTLWTPQKFQARMADPTAQGAPASTFRTPGWARTCLIKIAYPNDIA